MVEVRVILEDLVRKLRMALEYLFAFAIVMLLSKLNLSNLTSHSTTKKALHFESTSTRMKQQH
jgi:hypothetical protein